MKIQQRTIRTLHLLLLLNLIPTRTNALPSSISLDWSLESPDNPVKGFILDYIPPVGTPPSGTLLPPDASSVFINGTLPATEYTLFITALLEDGVRHNISAKRISSSPRSPILESIETTSTEATVSFFPPSEGSAEMNFNIEYHPVDRPEYSLNVDTKSPLIKLRGLEPGTTYKLRITSVFRGVRSSDRIETTFSTKEGKVETFTIRTLPPDFDLILTREREKNGENGTTTKASIPSGEILIKASEEDETTPSTIEITEDKASEVTSSEVMTVGARRKTLTYPSTTTVKTTTNRETTVKGTKSTPVLRSYVSKPTPMIHSFVFATMPSTTPISSPSTDSSITTTVTSPTTTTVPSTISTTSTPTSTTSTTTTSVSPSITTTPPSTKSTVTTLPSMRASTTTKTTAKMAPPYSETVVDTDDNNEIVTVETTTNVVIGEIEEGENEMTFVDEKPPRSPAVNENVQSLSSLGNINGFGEPSTVFLSRTEDNFLRVDWEVPESTVCDSFLLNYTLLTLNEPKTLSSPTNEQWTQIKMYSDHSIQLDVFCMIADAASKTWWAHRVADLSKPQGVDGLRVVSSATDEFYVSTVGLDINWPPLHDFSLYKIVIAYAEGKTLKDAEELELTEKGPIVIEKLLPSKWYTFSVKNVSVELDLASAARGIRELTAPIISSTLQPGQISSTSININFDPSDPDQGRFDGYELVFTGNAKNITKKVGMNAARSFTFTKLIPGKTYTFELYTVFEGRRSRAVTTSVTTYPLKVNKLFPVVGRDYVVLFWDIENFADNDCRFRVAYTGTAGNGHQTSSTVVLKNKNTYKFDKLPGDTYYTFTCTVIMGIGTSEAESESEMITISIGQPPRGVPLLQRHGTRELAIQFENDPAVFSEQNGEVDNFAVIVTEKVDLGGDDYDLHSWFEVKDDDKWPAYRTSASDYNPFRGNRKKSATFIIGADDCNQRRLDEPFCNGMLHANVDYFVKVRAYTKEGVALETEWVGVNRKEDGEGQEEEKEKGLPCHMYLNGCPRKSTPKESSSFFQPLLTLLGLIRMF